MSKKLRNGLALFAAATICFSAVGASALSWRMNGYDAQTYPTVEKIYEQVDDHGIPTGPVVQGVAANALGLEGFAKEVKLADKWAELAYPNNEYLTLFVDGYNTGVYKATGRSLVYNYRDAAYTWELAAPHKIYQQTQAYVGTKGVNGWYTDDSYPISYSGVNATVKANFNAYYGFGRYHVVDGVVTPLVDWEPLAAYATTLNNDLFSIGDNRLGWTNAPGKTYDATNELIFNVPTITDKSFNLVLEGPVFEYDGTILPGNEFGLKVDAAKKYDATLAGFKPVAGAAQELLQGRLDPTLQATLANFAVADLVKYIPDSFTGINFKANTQWINAGYEAVAPYRYYEVLSVDGVMMDGSLFYTDELGQNYYKPYIYRYNGALADPFVVNTFANPFFNPPTIWEGQTDRP